jgi:hypothetical protein
LIDEQLVVRVDDDVAADVERSPPSGSMRPKYSGPLASV